jgi:hypothetical protein
MSPSAQAIANYARTLQNREQQEQSALNDRFQSAWETAQAAAQVLVALGGDRVMVFGLGFMLVLSAHSPKAHTH